MARTDGEPHDLTWFESLYENEAVTEDNYSAEVEAGLYMYISGIKIEYGMQKIVFEYRNDSGDLLKRDTVPVLYSVKGEKGASYRGAYSSASSITSAVLNDTYLNTTDGYLYYYNGASWLAITDYTDTRYSQAINDMIANSNNTSYKDYTAFMGVINLWVKNLVAQTALINQLFAKQINLQNGGYIQSENYGNVNQPRLQYWNGTTWQDTYTTYDQEDSYAYIKVRASCNNGDTWVVLSDALTVSTDGSGLYVPYIEYRTSATVLDDSDDTATETYTALAWGDTITVSEETRYIKFHIVQEVYDSDSEDSEWFKVFETDKGGFRLSDSGTIKSGNYDEEKLLGYRLGADGKLICNQGEFNNIKIKSNSELQGSITNNVIACSPDDLISCEYSGLITAIPTVVVSSEWVQVTDSYGTYIQQIWTFYPFPYTSGRQIKYARNYTGSITVDYDSVTGFPKFVKEGTSVNFNFKYSSSGSGYNSDLHFYNLPAEKDIEESDIGRVYIEDGVLKIVTP